ncbi:hypothetical protein N9383_05870 [Granulosicoccus sp.]|nr:hypothetical protein [Granulosicoccus sp.]
MKKYVCISGAIFCATILWFIVTKFDRNSGELKAVEIERATQTTLQGRDKSDGDLSLDSVVDTNDRLRGSDGYINIVEDIAEISLHKSDPVVYDDVLKSLYGNSEQSTALYTAQENLVRKCMNELGFEYQVGQFAKEKTITENVQSVDHGDIADAKTRGYGIYESLGYAPDRALLGDSVESVNSDEPDLAIENENTVYLESLPEYQRKAWNEALLGRFDSRNPSASGSIVKLVNPDNSQIMWDSNSCVSAASRTLYGSDITHKENLIAKEDLYRKFNEEILTDSIFVSVLADWSDCMAAHDLYYKYPGAAAGILHSLFIGGEISKSELRESEIEIATKDAECYQESNLDEMVTSVEMRIGELQLVEHADEINDLHSALLEAVDTAGKYQ